MRGRSTRGTLRTAHPFVDDRERAKVVEPAARPRSSTRRFSRAERRSHPLATGVGVGATSLVDPSTGTDAAPSVVAPDDLPAATRPSLARLVVAFTLVAVVGAVIPLVAAHHYGALGIPRGDDWSYLRTLFRWHETGRLNFNHWVSMTLLGQLVLAWPIVAIAGHHITPVQVLTALLGLGGLGAVLSMGLSLGRKLWLATFVALLVAVTPYWGALAAGFMTDIPAFGVAMIATALAVRAFARRPVSMPLLLASIAVGFVGFTIREYAAIPLVATILFAGFTFISERDTERFRTLARTTLFVAVLGLVFLVFWHTIPDTKGLAPRFPSSHSISNTMYKGSGLLRLLGLVLTPVVLLAGPLRIVRRAWRAGADTTVFLTLGVTAWLAFTGHRAPRVGFAGNYVVPLGILGRDVSAGPRQDIFPKYVWGGMLVVGTISAVLLTLAAMPALVTVTRRMRALDFTVRDPIRAFLALALSGYIAAYATVALLGLPIYDRYLLPIIPLAALLLVSSPELAAARNDAARTRAPWRLGAASIALLLLAAIGFTYTLDSASFDGTRWKVDTEVVHLGWGPKQISGGFEWINTYSPSPGTHVRKHLKPCVAVVVNPRPQRLERTPPLATAVYHTPFKHSMIVAAFRTARPCTPSSTPSGS